MGILSHVNVKAFEVMLG